LNAGLTRPNPWLLWGGISLMTVIWTLNPIAGKIAMRDFPPMLLVALRTAASGAMIGAVLWFKRRSQPKVAGKDWLLLLFFGVGLQVGNQIAFINGLGRTSVAHTAFVYALTPILVLALASYRGQEGFRARKLFGMVICIFGVMLLVRDQAGGEATPLGDAIVFVGIIMFSCFTVFGKELQVRYGGVLLNAFAYMAGGIVLQPVVWLGYPDFDFPGVAWQSWAALSYMAAGPAVLGYLIYYWALSHVPASRVAAMQYLHPPLATGFSALFLGETVTLTLGIAGATILLGVFLTERG